MHKTHRKKRTPAIAWALCKAVLLGTAAATALMLLFTLLLFLEWLPESAIPVGNAIVKVAAACFVGFWIGRTGQVNAWLLGGAAGVLFLLLTTALFSLFVGSFRPTWTLLSDALLSFAVAAATAGIVAWQKKPASKGQ